MSQFSYTAIFAVTSSIFVLSLLPSHLALTIGFAALLSWWLTKSLIPKVSEFMIKKRHFGLDLNKKGSKEGQKQIPQCVGFSAAVAFCMVGMIITIVLRFWSSSQNLTSHLAIFVTVIGTILLGFADDMLDLPWRYKLLFPFFIVMPLISVYTGISHIVVIQPFSWIFGNTIELGYIYLLYLTLLGIYQTNAINIYAGINGLEVGQSIIAASSTLIYFFVDGLLRNNIEKYTQSIYLLTTFVMASLAVMKLNAYPAKIFVGDTFCYFSGIVLAISAIWGQIPIICHWFLFPQLINFLYSIPQLFGFVECPRHRLTEFDVKTNKLRAIPTNLNLLNLSLRILGPTNEGALCLKLLVFQTLTSSIPILYNVWSSF